MSNPKAKTVKSAGALKYDAATHPKQAYKLMLLGAKLSDLAKFFEVADQISVGEFVLRFTGAEFAAITAAAGSDANVAGILATLRARDSVRLGSVDAVQWVVEAIPIEQMQAHVGAAVQSMIDGVCTSGVPYFRDIFSARGYVNDPNPTYHARAVALRDWSSSVWTALDEIQADVMAGNRPLPTIAELLAELPAAPG